MKQPTSLRVLTWSTWSLAIAAAVVAFATFADPNTADAGGLSVPEPAILLLLGVGLSAVSVRVRPRRRSQESPDRSSR